MAEGVTHISFHHTRIRSRETGENRKTNEQQSLGLPRAEKRYCNTICMCRLSLAWVTSENSTMLLESDILRLFFTGPYLVSSPLCSGVWGWLPLRSSTPTSAACLSQGRVVNSHSPPRTTSGYGEISCPRILCLVSRQNRQLNRLLWQPTPIVLQFNTNNFIEY